MKKILYSMGLVLLMASCSNDDITEWADPMSNEEEAAQTITMTIGQADPIDYATLTTDSVQLFVPDVTVVRNDSIKYTVALYNADKSQSQTLKANAQGYADANEVKTAVEALYGKKPEAREIATDVTSYVFIGGESYKLNGSTTTTVTLVAPFIAEAYYLVGDMCGWDATSMIAFSHSSADVYDDPVFTVMFSTNGENKYWKIIPQSNIDAGDFWHEGETGVVGVANNGDSSLSGYLVAVSGVGAGMIEQAGYYKMTINMMDYTYSIEAVTPQYYITGNPNGWGSDISNKQALMYPQSITVHSYTTKYNGAWDVKIWSANDYGNWDVAYGSQVDGATDVSGSLVNSGAGAISSPEAGFYTLTIDMSTMTYTWTKLANQAPTEYAQISLSGDLNGWGDTDLTAISTSPHNWYALNVPITGGSIKFKANHDWGTNWGADVNIADTYYGKGTQDGANISIPEGTYNVYFNDITGEFAFVAQ